jgi:hypothetical protein
VLSRFGRNAAPCVTIRHVNSTAFTKEESTSCYYRHDKPTLGRLIHQKEVAAKNQTYQNFNLIPTKARYQKAIKRLAPLTTKKKHCFYPENFTAGQKFQTSDLYQKQNIKLPIDTLNALCRLNKP